jgi:ABC-type arginine transport system ATPase subunit
MKALQNDKQTIQQNKKHKEAKNGKTPLVKKPSEIDLANSMVFSEYEVWPILAELNNLKN